jgi:methylated-DNA-[protein]-cysteine S-methyltransferase
MVTSYDAVGQAGDLPPVLRQAVEELREYFAGERREFTLPLAPAGTPFQQQVWAALREIPYGATCSYGRIAGRIGRPKACRAVGMANNRNPIAIVVPCHRVVGASGALVGYAAGLEVKEKLLALESMNNE